MSFINKLISVALAVVLSAVLIQGCGKKEKTEKVKKEVSTHVPEYIEVTLANNEKVSIDTVTFGIKNLPPGKVLSYELVPDERHLIDELGKPLVQQVNKHQMIIESDLSIDDLIKFFFPSTPTIVNRRKRGEKDIYARLVSSKDVNTVRSLEKPYIVVDIRLETKKPKRGSLKNLYPADIQTADSSPISSWDDQIAALKSRIDILNDMLEKAQITIQERQNAQDELVLLKRQLTIMEDRKLRSAKSSARAQGDQQDTNNKPAAPKVKIKINSYYKR